MPKGLRYVSCESVRSSGRLLCRR